MTKVQGNIGAGNAQPVETTEKSDKFQDVKAEKGAINRLKMTKRVDESSIHARFVKAIGDDLNAKGMKALLAKLNCSETMKKIPDGFPASMFNALENGEMTVEVAKKLLNEFDQDLKGNLSAGQGVQVFKMNISAQDKLEILQHFDDDLRKGEFADYLAYKLIIVAANEGSLKEGADLRAFFDSMVTAYETDETFLETFDDSLDTLITSNQVQNELSMAVHGKFKADTETPIKDKISEKLSDVDFLKSLLSEGEVQDLLTNLKKLKSAKDVEEAAKIEETPEIKDEFALLLESEEFGEFIKAFGEHISTRLADNPHLLRSLKDAESFLIEQFNQMVSDVFEDDHDLEKDSVGKSFVGLVKKFTELLEPGDVKKVEKSRAKKVGAMIVLILKKTLQGVKNSYQMYIVAAGVITPLVPILIGLGVSGPIGWGIGAGLLGALILYAFIRGVMGAAITKEIEAVKTAAEVLAPMAAAMPKKEGAPEMDPTFKLILDFGQKRAKEQEEADKKKKEEEAAAQA